ncbi:hypothetical protein [Halomonas sp. QHL1]|uniref:hypothetical protein n=1 Tax=Halomonas sp. QHL1 TaxID=1123773 RepID=UPI0015871103|nr:hypothetical protein [Halomonas sp. QHL1]
MQLSPEKESKPIVSDQLRPLWALFSKHGDSLRVVASAAELLGFVEASLSPIAS